MKQSHEERFGHELVLRGGRRDCLICHRAREMRRNRGAGAQPRKTTADHEVRFGHPFESRSGKRDCKVCHRTKANEWRLANLGESRRRAREYARKHPAEAKQRLRHWKVVNAEHARRYFREAARKIPAEVKRARKRRAYHNNLEHYRAYGRTSQMRRHGSREAAEYAEVVRRDPCSYCGGAGGQADHIVPIAGGGLHDPENLTGACIRCNSSKGDKHLLAFLAFRLEPAA